MGILRIAIIALVSTALLIPIAGYSSNIISNEPLLIALTFGVGYFIVPAILLKLWPAPRDPSQKSMEQALQDGELETAEYEVLGVAQVEELEDEGLAFLVAIPSGQTLCLCGQYLYAPVERRQFPSVRFRLHRNRVTNLVYGIAPVGQLLPSWPVFTSFTSEQLESRSSIVPEDGALYAQSIAELVGALGLRPIAAEPGTGEARS
jgi:hypothetical protein